MDWTDDEFFDDEATNPVDAAVAALKEAIKESIRADIRAEVDRLRRENAGLQDIRSRWDELNHEMSVKEQQLSFEIRNARETVRKARLEELITASDACVWGLKAIYTQRPKCDACDKHRQITYTNPQGREKTDACQCANYDVTYEPVPYLCVEAGFDSWGKKVVAFYKALPRSTGRGEYLALDEGSTLRGTIIPHGIAVNYLDLTTDAFFRDWHDCSAFCRWLNHQQKGA